MPKLFTLAIEVAPCQCVHQLQKQSTCCAGKL